MAVNSAESVHKFGNVEVRFPNSSWNITEPPAQIRDAYLRSPISAKVTFHAVSMEAQLRFHVVEMLLEGNSDRKLSAVAGLLVGVKRRCERQAFGGVQVSTNQINGITSVRFDAGIDGSLFLRITALLTTDRVFLLEIGGPIASMSEAGTLIDKVSLIGAMGFTDDDLAKIAKIQLNPPVSPQMRGYQIGRRLGWFFGFAVTAFFVLGGVITVVVLIFKKKTSSKKITAANPPPLPPAPPPLCS